MVHFRINGVECIGLHPAYPHALKEQILQAIPLDARVAVVDIPSVHVIRDFVEQMEQCGPKLVCYIDHHADEVDDIDYAKTLRRQLGSEAVIVGRCDHPATTQLVSLGKWQKLGVSVCLFSVDFDGIAAAWIGAGVEYRPNDQRSDNIDRDAIIMDGGGHGTRIGPISQLIADVMYWLTIPVYVNPEEHCTSLSALLQILVEWVARGALWDDPLIQDLGVRAKAARRKAIQNAFKVLSNAFWKSRHDGVILVNLCAIQRGGDLVNVSFLRKQIRKKFGKDVIICERHIDHSGREVCTIASPIHWRDFDLRDALPCEFQRQGPFRITFLAEYLDDFLCSWHQYLVRNPRHPSLLSNREKVKVVEE